MFNFSNILESLKKYDYSFFLIGTVIFTLGIINLHSATHASSTMANLYKTQILYFLFSFSVGAAISFINVNKFYRYSYSVYFFNIVLLILVLVMGHQVMGAKRWLVMGSIRIQPSELMKLSLVLALARWFAKTDPDQDLGLRKMIVPFIIAFIPTLLIVAEPDLGTGVLGLLIFFTICFYRKLRWKSIFVLAILGLLSGGLLYKFGLKDYQRQRIITFLNPDADARGTGYNAIQSKIAIGSGKFFGKGYKKSSQASLNYLPENHNDFVFSIYNEEHGFFGSLLLISLYCVLFYRFIWLASTVTRIFDSIVVVGVMSIFFWHTFINMSMVTGLMPIVGLPLPLMSYGGSSLLTFGLCCGVATSVSNAKRLF